MPIAITDRITAKTADKIVANSNEIAYTSGDTSEHGNTIADQITNILNNKQYVTSEQWDDMSDNVSALTVGVEYNIYEE